MRLRWRFFAALLLLLCAHGAPGGAAQPGWEAEWERTVKAAEQEGEVNYYTLGEVGFVSEFEKKFPRIKVRVIQGKGNELLTRIMAERRGGRFIADVVRIGNTSPYALYQAKALQPIAPAFILPEVKDESKWWSGRHQYIDSEGKYIFVPVGSVSVNMVAYNSELVAPTELNSFWDLLHEKWRAKIVVIDPRATGYGRSGARAVVMDARLHRASSRSARSQSSGVKSNSVPTPRIPAQLTRPYRQSKRRAASATVVATCS